MFRPQLIRSTNGLYNELALDANIANYDNVNYRKSVALSKIFLRTSPNLTAFKLLKKSFTKLKC